MTFAIAKIGILYFSLTLGVSKARNTDTNMLYEGFSSIN